VIAQIECGVGIFWNCDICYLIGEVEEGCVVDIGNGDGKFV